MGGWAKSKRKGIERRLGAFAFASAEKWLVKRDVESAERAGARLGRALYKASRKHRERALSNLALAMPELSASEREHLARKTFEHFGRMTADFVRSGVRTPEELNSSITVEGLEYVQDALCAGKGALMISGHFGNWERMSSWMPLNGFPLSVIARNANDEGLNARVNRLREKSGVKVIPRGNATRPILECLRRNELVAILPDQNSDEIFIPFFGKVCGTVLGPGVLHERTGAPVILGHCIWIGPGSYHTTFCPPLVSESIATVKGEGMMRTINVALESAIRKHPEQWLWFHDRWKNARKRGLI